MQCILLDGMYDVNTYVSIETKCSIYKDAVIER